VGSNPTSVFEKFWSLARQTNCEDIVYKYVKKKIGKNKTRDEHRLVMENYLGRKLDRKEIVHHKNGDKRDNRIENLELMDISEHARMHTKGNLVNAIFCKEEVVEIRKLLSCGYPRNRIAKQYGVSYDAIRDIDTRKNWKFI
jgi:hypothetical protein